MRPYRNKKYTEWVKTLPCSHCKSPADDPHHLIDVGMGGSKAPDFACVPLCRKCHSDVHSGIARDWPQARWMIETLSEAIRQGVVCIKGGSEWVILNDAHADQCQMVRQEGQNEGA